MLCKVARKDETTNFSLPMQSIAFITCFHIATYLTFGCAVAAPLGHLIITLSHGRLLGPHCTDTFDANQAFWQKYAELQTAPLAVCFALMVTRAWLFYESHRFLAIQDISSTLYMQKNHTNPSWPKFKPWAYKWRLCAPALAHCTL